MEFEFAKRFENMSGSAIRAIFALLKDPDIISFGGGNPASEAFPSEMLSEIAIHNPEDFTKVCETAKNGKV